MVRRVGVGVLSVGGGGGGGGGRLIGFGGGRRRGFGGGRQRGRGGGLGGDGCGESGDGVFGGVLVKHCETAADEDGLEDGEEIGFACGGTVGGCEWRRQRVAS